MTRDQLVAALQQSRQTLEQSLSGLDEARYLEPGVVEGWTVKDLLAHLTAWEVELITTLGTLQRGQRPRGVVWSAAQVQESNARWYAAYQERELERVRADFLAVRPQTLRQVERLAESDLHEPRPWLNGDTLENMIEVYTLEHESEHQAHIRAWRTAKGY